MKSSGLFQMVKQGLVQLFLDTFILKLNFSTNTLKSNSEKIFQLLQKDQYEDYEQNSQSK